MRILHCIRSVNPAGGGPIEGVNQLAKYAMLLGHEIEIVSLDSPKSAFVSQTHVPVWAMGPVFGSYGITHRLTPWIRRNSCRFDIVVINGIWQFQSFGAWRALRKGKVPYVVFTHGMLDPWFKNRYPLKHLKKWMYWPWAEYRVLRDAAAVLFTCAEERVLARQSFWLYRANERVVNYGTAEPPEDDGTQRLQFERNCPAASGKRLAVFLGRIHQKKGCDLVIEAFASQLASNPEWHLIMAGPDQVGWQAELERLAIRLGVSDRITWTGAVSGSLKWGILRAAELFYYPPTRRTLESPSRRR